MKFGKHIQKRQLEVPEYAASFVNYKALKKLIKKLSATPTLSAQTLDGAQAGAVDSRALLQANKATFFFQLERELEKVNAFYLQKEAELNVRLKTLLDKKKVLQTRGQAISRRSSKFTTLEEGFQQFVTDLNKLQQFVDINGTAFSKILKKWDKSSKSKTKELYLSRAVEVQPFFNPTVISELSDQATTSLQELGAWLDGDNVNFDSAPDRVVTSQNLVGTDEGDADTLLLDTVISGNLDSLRDLLNRMNSAAAANGGSTVSLIERVTRIFLTSIHEGTQEALQVLIDTGLVDIQSEDDINERNCLHQATIYGRPHVLGMGLLKGVSPERRDVYGRVPLHYASLHGRLDMLDALLADSRDTIDYIDHDNFTPLIHAIIHGHLECVERLLAKSARLDPVSDADHVPLNLACEHGSVAIVGLLLKHGAKIVPDAEGLYPQHLVARSNQTPDLLILLGQYGANLDQIDKMYGWTPLIHAAGEGNVACLQALLDADVDPTITDEKDLPAMYYAALEGHLECMRLLSPYSRRKTAALSPAPMVGSSAPVPMALDADSIPELELPPPIIPLRRYGHNFLETKTVVQIIFDDDGEQPLVFFQDGKYPAARLTISSKIADLIPKNVILPFQEDTRMVSFQVDSLDSFTLDFDVYPTYGAKVIAKTVVLPSIFKAQVTNPGGKYCLPIFDPRLRAIGQITFQAQVIKPFTGKPLEITDFETYWKATSQLDRNPSTIVTGSSLSGDFVRLYVQYTSDGCPVLWPRWKINCGGIDIPVRNLCSQQFDSITSKTPGRARLPSVPFKMTEQIPEIHDILATAGVQLDTALSLLPPRMHVNLQILYSTPDEERLLNLGPSVDLNAFADAILTIVFGHARAQRAQSPHEVRSVVFSSYNARLCTAVNWKQPNFPVFLCNDLGQDDSGGLWGETGPEAPWQSVRKPASIKEAVRVAQSNNFMGLVCSGRLLDMVPELVESIKSHGLALVMDKSFEFPQSSPLGAGAFLQPPTGIDGILKRHGVLTFNECIDI